MIVVRMDVDVCAWPFSGCFFSACLAAGNDSLRAGWSVV